MSDPTRPRNSYWQRGHDGKDGPTQSDFATEYGYRIAREGWLNGREAAGLKWAGGFVERLADVDGAVRQWREAHPQIVEAWRDEVVSRAAPVTAAGLLQEGRRLEAKLVEVLTRGTLTPTPIPMVLHCPACGLQHIDKPQTHQPEGVDVALVWTNPPHRSHQCQGCAFEWRPADVPTVGVEAVTTRGKNDGPLPSECIKAHRNGSCACKSHHECPYRPTL